MARAKNTLSVGSFFMISTVVFTSRKWLIFVRSIDDGLNLVGPETKFIVGENSDQFIDTILGAEENPFAFTDFFKGPTRHALPEVRRN